MILTPCSREATRENNYRIFEPKLDLQGMTPRFAHAVDPVFSYVLDLLDRIHRHEHPSPQEQRLVIRGLLEQAEAILGTGADWELARYAIISWIDELLVDSPWEGAEWWSNNVLEMELFNTRACFEQFYVRAREASKLPQRDALEVFYVCMMLGFRGLYRDPQLQQSFLEAHGLPLDLEDWARQTGLSIRLGQGRPELASPEQDLIGATKLTTRAFPVWSWVAALMMAIAVSVWYLSISPGLAGT
jgi:type VI secretion system protein ImpK